MWQRLVERNQVWSSAKNAQIVRERAKSRLQEHNIRVRHVVERNTSSGRVRSFVVPFAKGKENEYFSNAVNTVKAQVLSLDKGDSMVAVPQEKKVPASWQEAEAWARRITDGMGCPIDEGILETVVVFHLLGIPTCQSCEGHLHEGLPYPWVDFETDEFPAFKQALEEASREGLSQQEREARGATLLKLAQTLPSRGVLYARIEELLDLYYRQHPTVPEVRRLVLHWSSPILFRLMPSCGYEADTWDQEIRAHQLAYARAEMQAFTAFLKQRWQSKALIGEGTVTD